MFVSRLVLLGVSILALFASLEGGEAGCLALEADHGNVSSGIKANPLVGTTLTVTIYETSPGLKDLLYSTTQLLFKEDGSTEIESLAGISNDGLGMRLGRVTFAYQKQNATVFIHKDDAFDGYFTNVLYKLSETTGELISTNGDQYVKGYTKIQQISGA